MKTIIKYLIVISYLGTVTNFIPLSVIVIFFIPLSVISIFFNGDAKFRKIEIYIIVLFVYVIFSTLFYAPDSFLDYDFYRKDGNFIISYLVLLFYVFLPFGLPINVDKLISQTLPIFAFISIIGIVALPNEEAGVKHFFFVAHNAAGGFYSLISGVAISYYLSTKEKKYALYSIIFFACLWMTDSRGSVLAILLTIIYWRFFKFRWPGTVFVIFLLLQLAIILYTYPIWVKMGKPLSYSDIDVTAAVNMERAHTFLDRLYILWPRAFDNFLHSMLVGMGFSSYDDLWVRYNEIIPYLFSIKMDNIIVHTDSHAHNSTFAILAELGLVGYILFILLFSQILSKINELKTYNPHYSLMLLFSFWSCVFSSGTEHRITTPSQMVPFFTLFGIGYITYLHKRKKVDS